MIETHISVVVLAGDRAYKLKRAVKLDYVDFSTAELRLALCEREVELNRRAVPGLYLGVRRITRAADGRLAFDGDGPLVDAVVEMVRFDQDGLFDRMAVRGALTPALLAELAVAVARLHETAPAELAGGGADQYRRRAVPSTSGRWPARRCFPSIPSSASTGPFARRWQQAAPLLDRRQRLGKVRHCHGDLHLGNICLFDGHPAPFDCLEFDDAMATVDVLYDLAFLLMDLWHRDLKAGANLVLNRYLDVARRERRPGAGAVPDGDPRRRARPCQRHAGGRAGRGGQCRKRCAGDAVSYFHLAQALLRPVPPRLVAIGGFSGAGQVDGGGGDRAGGRCAAGCPGAVQRPHPQAHGRRRADGAAAGAGLSPRGVAGGLRDARARGGIPAGARPRRRPRCDLPPAGGARPGSRRWRPPSTCPSPASGWSCAPEKLIERVEGRGADPSDANAETIRHQIDQFRGPITWTAVSAEGSVDEVVGAGPRADRARTDSAVIDS